VPIFYGTPALRLPVPLAVDTNAKWLDRKYVSWENMEHDNEVEEEFTEKFCIAKPAPQ